MQNCRYQRPIPQSCIPPVHDLQLLLLFCRDRCVPSLRIFSIQTSIAESPCEVNAILASPETSLGRPYSLPSVSRIYRYLQLSMESYLDVDPLSIAFASTDSSGDDDEGICSDEIPYTPRRDVSLMLGMDLVLERMCSREEWYEKGEQRREMHGNTSTASDPTAATQQQENLGPTWNVF